MPRHPGVTFELVPLVSGAAVLLATAVVERRHRDSRRRDLRRLATAQGWRYTDRDDTCLAQAGLAATGASSRPVGAAVRGRHGAHEVLAAWVGDLDGNGDDPRRSSVLALLGPAGAPDLPTLSVRPRRPADGVPGHARRGRGLVVDSAEFVSAYVVEAQDEALAWRVLTPARCERLLAGHPLSLTVQGPHVVLEAEGSHGPADLLGRLRLLVGLTDALVTSRAAAEV